VSALLDGISGAFELISGGDRELVDITLRTLRIAGESTVIATAIGLPLGAVLGLGRFRGRTALLALANAGLRFPPIALGQILWLLMWPDSPWGGGPLAGLGWLYTPNAAILAQTLLALPIITALTAAAVQRVPAGLLAQAAAFGAPPIGRGLLALREARVGVIAAITTGLGTAIASVGAIIVVGNSLGSATLATAALTQWNAGGADAAAVAYGTVLLGLFLVIAAALTTLQHRRTTWIPGRVS
jgi:tungstate transport system permease protein